MKHCQSFECAPLPILKITLNKCIYVDWFSVCDALIEVKLSKETHQRMYLRYPYTQTNKQTLTYTYQPTQTYTHIFSIHSCVYLWTIDSFSLSKISEHLSSNEKQGKPQYSGLVNFFFFYQTDQFINKLYKK